MNCQAKLTTVILITLVNLLMPLSQAHAQEQEPINIHFFWSPGCPHCAAEKAYLEKIKTKYPRVEIKSYNIEKPGNAKILQKAKQELGILSPTGTPITFIGEHCLIGFGNEKTSGEMIEEAVQCALEEGCNDVVCNLVTDVTPQGQSGQVKQDIPKKISLPIFGEVKTANISLPALSVVLGLLDGFNPCAMWALLFLISLLLGMENKTRMWLFGTTFIVASAAVYFLFLTAWLNLFLVIGYLKWIRYLVALVALGAGIYNIRDFIVNKDGGCKVTEQEKRRSFFEKLKAVTKKDNFFIALGGIIALAAAVNMVELVCSAGLPAVFTNILSLSNLPTWKYYLFIFIYIFFFMIDDLFVFFAAMKTLHMVGIEGKYARYSRIIGGILMLAIGTLLIFKPSWLMFG